MLGLEWIARDRVYKNLNIFIYKTKETMKNQKKILTNKQKTSVILNNLNHENK